MRFGYYNRLSLRNTIRLIPVPAARGRVYDRNNKPLAINDLSFDLVLIPQEVKDLEATLEALSKIVEIPTSQLSRNYKKSYHLPFAPARIASRLSREKAFYIEEKLHSIPGALIWSTPRRYYPNGTVASHIIGYVGNIRKSEYAYLRDYGYKIQDLVGKTGIEKSYDAYLKGDDGGIQIEVDAASREIKRRGFKEPQKGKDIQLTIDLGLQAFVDMLIEEKKGAVVIMETETGKVLALTSSPEFDPNIFILGSNRARREILNDRARPLINRAISGTYPPGSTFKVVIACAGIVGKAITSASSYVCNGIFEIGGIKFRCWRETGHGPQNIVEAITHSCNVFFYNMGRRIGVDNIYKYALQFGFGNQTGVDLPEEKKGILPSALWKRLRLREPWYKGDTINYSIGQGYLLVTPIQMLKAATIIANRGYCPTPYIVEEIEGRTLTSKKRHRTKIREGHFRLVREGMSGVVNDKTGTGKYAKIEGIKIAGKTGTAQPGTEGDTHAWFIGYLPADNPRFSFVVFLEHGGQGGAEPAHITRLIATYMKENGFFD